MSEQHHHPHDDTPLPVQPGQVMRREHYERMAAEAAQQEAQQK
jgi:hypothetical protein